MSQSGETAGKGDFDETNDTRGGAGPGAGRTRRKWGGCRFENAGQPRRSRKGTRTRKREEAREAWYAKRLDLRNGLQQPARADVRPRPEALRRRGRPGRDE